MADQVTQAAAVDGGKAEWIQRVLGVSLVTDTAQDAGAAFAARLAALRSRVKQALRSAAPDAGGLKAKIDEAAALGRKQDCGAGMLVLDQLETLLDAEDRFQRAATQDAPSGTFSKVGFEKLHLEWETSKKLVHARIDRLTKAILDEDPDAAAQTAQTKLGGILAVFNEDLSDTLDRLRNAEAAEDRAVLAAQAIRISSRYLGYLESPLVSFVDQGNPYGIAIDAKSTLAPPLGALQKQLGRIKAP